MKSPFRYALHDHFFSPRMSAQSRGCWQQVEGAQEDEFAGNHRLIFLVRTLILVYDLAAGILRA
jgi:hypothetical protein